VTVHHKKFKQATKISNTKSTPKEKQTMKSIEVQFSGALEALDKAGKRKQYDGKVRYGMSIETKLNVAQTVLKEAGVDIHNLEEFCESAGIVVRLEELKEQQYQSALAGGMSEAEARGIADLCGKQR
jgi:hypothetical protein